MKWFAGYPELETLMGVLAVVIVSMALYVVASRFGTRLLRALAKRSPTSWDEVILDAKVADRLFWAIPLLVWHQGLQWVPRLAESAELQGFLQRLALMGLALVSARTMSALLAGVNTIYGRYALAASRPIKGYIQIAQIVVYAFGAVLGVAVLMEQSPWYILSGMGAMTAILLLVFRDTLLSLVAGIQLTSNDLIRLGDWVEMPQFDADGDVVEIALNNVRVQNWDRTYTVIPTHKFLEHSFRNWRGMTESGGRRIKRAISIDMSTVRFLDNADIERFAEIGLLRDYVSAKREELAKYNEDRGIREEAGLNCRRLTNLGMFRIYIVEYLRAHPGINPRMIRLVRQLDPTPEGLPIELYVFTNETAWGAYESIQADVFDHLLAAVPEFGLRVYQKPSGADLASWGAS